jgi:hypothetical protein
MRQPNDDKLAWEIEPKEITKRLLKGMDGELRYNQRDKERAIDDALFAIMLDSNLHHPGVPGEVIEHLSDKTRDILQHCTAKDWMQRIPDGFINDRSLEGQIRKWAPNWKKQK